MTGSNRLRDRYGLALATHSAAAAEGYVEGVDRLLSLNAGAAEGLRRAVEADQGFALPHAARAILLRFRGEAEEAKASAQHALALSAGISRRERQHLEIVAAYVVGEAARALALIREHLAEFPRDALLLSQAAFVLNASGRRDRQRELIALVEAAAPAYGDDWWFQGLAAIAYQEVDELERARRLAQRSLEVFPRNASAAHPLAHVFYETDDHAGGVDFLRGWIAGYDRRAPYHSHLSWHLALCELASGHHGRALEVYEDAIGPAATRTRLAFFDAASLLWRFELYGCAGGPLPWGEVRDLGARLFPRPALAFADAHVGLACAGAGDEAALGRLVDGLRTQAAGGHPVAGSVVLPLVQAVAAFARGEYAETVRLLEPLTGEVVRIGGTNAQREVFEDTLLEAYLRSERFDNAEALLRRRLNRRPSTRDFFWLGRAQASSGQPEQAQQSLLQAQARWSHADPASPELAAVGHLMAAASAGADVDRPSDPM